MKNIYIFLFISLLFLIPSFSHAKEITCSNSTYNAIVNIDKTKLFIEDEVKINITSDSEYSAKYISMDKDIVSINEDGKVKANKEGKTTIGVEIEFTSELSISSCKVEIEMEVVDNVSTLKTLSIEEYPDIIKFEKNKYEYTVTLPYNVDKINILAEASSQNAFVSGDGRKYISEVDDNIFEIKVVSTAGVTSTYTIKVLKDKPNTDSTLSNLIVEGYVLTPKFDKNIKTYKLKITSDIDTINIHATPTYEFSKIKGDGTVSLATGKNVYKIIVTAEDKSQTEYEVIVKKGISNVFLDNLKVTDYKLIEEFKKDRFIYHIEIPNKINKINILAESKDNSIEIIGNDHLKDGENNILIKVSNYDDVTTYKILVNKLTKEQEKEREKKQKLLKFLLILFIISIVVMIGFISIFIKRNYKRIRRKKKR